MLLQFFPGYYKVITLKQKNQPEACPRTHNPVASASVSASEAE